MPPLPNRIPFHAPPGKPHTWRRSKLAAATDALISLGASSPSTNLYLPRALSMLPCRSSKCMANKWMSGRVLQNVAVARWSAAAASSL